MSGPCPHCFRWACSCPPVDADAATELELLRQVIRLIVEDTADPSTHEMRCFRWPEVNDEQNAAVVRALGAAS
jgi:hypothetical protein